MMNPSRCREKMGGWIGRKRNYHCRECGNKFQVDTLRPLPEIDRVCPSCKARTTVFTFIDKKTGKERRIRAASGELATLRAWAVNPNLTIKIVNPN